MRDALSVAVALATVCLLAAACTVPPRQAPPPSPPTSESVATRGNQQVVPTESRAEEAWESSLKKDTIDAYQSFLREYSGTKFESAARARLSFLKGEAVAVFYAPSVMRPWQSSPERSRYRWDGTFKETGGKSGFKVRSTEVYILFRTGLRHEFDWQESVEVKAGGSAAVHFVYSNALYKFDGVGGNKE